MSILLTGFNAFGNVSVNPSQTIIETIRKQNHIAEHSGLVAEILPTEFDAAGKRIIELIHHYEPNAVLSLGVSGHVPHLSLERVALNLDDADTPDNKGELRSGTLIDSDGPLAYLSTLPLDQLREGLEKMNIAVSISNHAGTYVCNHVFYVARHEIEKCGMNSKCGFIHVPMIKDEEILISSIHGISLDVIVKGVELCIRILGQATGE